MPSSALVKYVLTAALRDRLLIVLLVVIAVAGALGVFLGSAALTEKDKFALVFSAAGLRIAAMAGLMLFTVFYVRRAFDAREVEFLLSRPVSRTSFVLSHAIALSVLGAIVAVVVTAALFCVSREHAGVLYWGGSLMAELIIVANAAFFFAMVLSSATAAAMATLGLYILGRLMGEILGIIYANQFLTGYHLFAIPMKLISLFMPRLDLMAQSSWLVYGVKDSTPATFILAQGVVYTLVLVVAALIDFSRREF